jgi:hypothetical protein
MKETNCSLKDFKSKNWKEVENYTKLHDNLRGQNFFVYKDYNQHMKYTVGRSHVYDTIEINLYSGDNYKNKSTVFSGYCRNLNDLNKIEELINTNNL